MAITLIATPGASNANTYTTLADAETYFESRLHKTDWTDATDANKNIALVWATRLLDDYIIWDGMVASSTQALMWPRTLVYDTEGYPVNSGTIPSFLAEATAEFGMFLLADDVSIEKGEKGFKRLTLPGLDIYTDKRDRKGVVPQSVYAMIRDYGVLPSRQTPLLQRG